MKRFLTIFTAFIAVVSLTFVFAGCDDDDGGGVVHGLFEITSPYEGINWRTFGQYRATLHTHTFNSDGSTTTTMTNKINALLALHYDIVAITDHQWRERRDTSPYQAGVAWDPPNSPDRPLMNFLHRCVTSTEWTHGVGNLAGLVIPLSHITPERKQEILSGAARPSGRPMIFLPNSIELASGGGCEMNVFFFGCNEPAGYAIPRNAFQDGSNLRPFLEQTQNVGGIAFINHPGRTTGGNAGRTGDTVPNAQQLIDGAAASNNPTFIQRYLRYFNDFPADVLVGLEIFNRGDRDSMSDRILWDNLNSHLIPTGRFVWGYANDDSHNHGTGVGINYQVFVMRSNTVANVRSAMVSGASYMVTRTAFREGINVTMANSPMGSRPRITNISVNRRADTITITAENAHTIRWITSTPNPMEPTGGVQIYETVTDGTTVTSTIRLADLAEDVGSFVRANIIGPTGLAVTQPFGTVRRE